MKKLGSYKNGNYRVTILEDGTKIRYTPDNEYRPVKPESMDLKITNRCTGTNCMYCHEKSGPEGEHGDIMNLKFIDTLLPYTEIALGGGNVLEHPDLVPFLEKCKKRKLICNVTFNQVHFMSNLDFIKGLIEKKLIHGVGVSLVPTESRAEELAETLSDPIFSNAVVHVINGIHGPKVLRHLYGRGLKLLILGYKVFGRGATYYRRKGAAIDKGCEENLSQLKEIISNFAAVSFDNLAIYQLAVEKIMTGDEWKRFYMGDEGQFTMYIDAVKREYAVCSIAEERFPLEDDIEPMFKHIRKITGHDVDSQKKK